MSAGHRGSPRHTGSHGPKRIPRRDAGRDANIHHWPSRLGRARPRQSSHPRLQEPVGQRARSVWTTATCGRNRTYPIRHQLGPRGTVSAGI
jgi:hypothetical protein